MLLGWAVAVEFVRLLAVDSVSDGSVLWLLKFVYMVFGILSMHVCYCAVYNYRTLSLLQPKTALLAALLFSILKLF